MFRSSMRSSSGSSLFISLSMLMILKTITLFQEYYQSIEVMWQRMFSMPVMRTVWTRALDCSPAHFKMYFCSRICLQITIPRYPVVTSEIHSYLQNFNSTFFLIFAYDFRQYMTSPSFTSSILITTQTKQTTFRLLSLAFLPSFLSHHSSYIYIYI
jgi:hypothetical protein